MLNKKSTYQNKMMTTEKSKTIDDIIHEYEERLFKIEQEMEKLNHIAQGDK